MKQKILFLIFIAIFGFAAKAQTIVQSGDGWSLDSEGLLTVTKDFSYSSNYPWPWSASVESVKSVVLGDDVTSIGDYAFYNCSGLTSVTISESVESIGDYAFYNCSGLTSVTIPEGVTSIGQLAFFGCSSLTSITIPSSVTSIGESAFRGCSSLTSVTIPERVTSIDEYTFYDCKSLTSVTISEGVTSIDKYSFYGCSNLTNVTIPSSVTNIGKYAFRGCTSLTSIIIPEKVTKIEEYTFEYCTNLTSVTIPESVIRIGNSAFNGCSKIVELHIGSVESWCNISFGDDSSNPLGNLTTSKKLYVDGKEVEELVIPVGVQTIPNYAFSRCLGITSVTIPEGVSSIGTFAFYGCHSLTNVTILEGVEEICRRAFYSCSGLASVTIPESVKKINEEAFDGCKSINELHIGSIKSWCNIEFVESYLRPYSNPLYVTSSKNVKLYVGDKIVEELDIPEGGTSIGNYAFKNCSCIKVVTIPNTVTKIGNCAFAGCSGIMQVNFSGAIETFGQYIFESCSSLTSMTIGENVTTIDYGVFRNCTGLTSLSFMGNVDEISYGSENKCDNLKYVFLYQNDVATTLTEKFPTTVERFFVPDDILADYRSQYASNNDLKDKFTGFSLIEKRGENETEEEIVALSLEKDSYDFIAWAVNSGEKIRKDEEISIALTKDFDLDAENVTWQTLGTAEHPFKGIFDGNKHSVIGNRRADAVQPNSIFGYIGEDAEIRNVVFSGFIIDATSGGVTDGGTTYHGLVARENKGLIHNSIFEGRMEIDADAENADEAQACLVIDNEEGGELDHVIGYFEGLDGEVTGNKTSIIVIQNIGHGRTRGHSKKTASNGKKKSKGNSTVSAEVPDDINLNYRLFTDEEFAGAEPAYWLNFDGEGYTGTFNGEWTQGTKHPVLAKGEHGATVGVKYNVVNRDESVIGPSPVFFATSKSSLEVEYSEKPLSIEVNGMEINASQIGDMKAKFSLASVDTDKGNVNVVLKYEKQSTPTAVDDIDAAGSQKTIKTVENGRVVIIRDGKKYDLAGRVLSDKF